MSTTELVDRIKSLERRVEKQLSKPKDIWDILSAVSGLVTGVFIGGIGIILTQQYNQRQNQLRQEDVANQETATRIKALEVIRDFMPDLRKGSSEEIKNIILLIDRLVGSRIPGAVLGETLNSFCQSQDDVKALGRQMAINRLDELLERLAVFQPHLQVSVLQENPTEPGLQQNPYAYFVEPMLRQITGSDPISKSLPSEVVGEIDKVSRNPNTLIVDVKENLEAIISTVKGH
ncbi:hypothetical protein KQ306_10280 [Synechococcus sp. CS-1324]|uniref:hypothetical protein n=1 Tax=Synechococcus sp. CS-1324 TaxID=2847980 RepID=UPI00223C2CC2|nr:hypothetical protein [Synechococcus sp. CS-1324]MCT0231234.1 hypothetical protein [Synechococcus sp. CS-1324]